MTDKYCFVSDDDGHWYLIKVSQREDFDAWLRWTLGYQDPGLPDEWAGHDYNDDRIDGGPEHYSFTNPDKL